MARLMDAIKKDHRELEEYYNIIVSSGDTDEQIRFQNKFTWELARHAIGEELVVYPALEKYLPGGTETADKDRKEHQTVRAQSATLSSILTQTALQIKEKLQKFQDMHPSDASFMPILKSMMADLEKHIEEEETIDFVKLEDAITPKESESLSKSFGRTKMFVPTRSHPNTPNKPPFETVVGLLAAPIDHLADMFRKWPDDVINPNPSPE
jgi:iron-sulfur cluster repair protein YtfE (RIC family)